MKSKLRKDLFLRKLWKKTCAKLYSCENFMPQGSHFIAEDTMESYAKLTFSYRVSVRFQSPVLYVAYATSNLKHLQEESGKPYVTLFINMWYSSPLLNFSFFRILVWKLKCSVFKVNVDSSQLKFRKLIATDTCSLFSSFFLYFDELVGKI